MAKIKRYKNGDTCPCCGQVIEGKTREWLDLFSVRAAAIGFLIVSLEDMSRALDEWCRETEAGDVDP